MNEYNILFIHLWVVGHLGCFHLLAIVNNTARNIFEQHFLWTYIYIFLLHKAKSAVDWSCGNFLFNLLRNCQCLPKAAVAPFDISTRSECMNEGSRFSTPSPTLTFLFDYSHCRSVELYLILGLTCIFLLKNYVKHFLCVRIGCFSLFFGEMSVQILCPS